jgi:hypothetical protein
VPNTYQLIASVTVGAGGAANIDFTSIPGIYTDLIVKFSLRSTASDSGGSNPSDARLSFNNSTSGYSERMIYTDNATSVASAATSGSGFFNWAGTQNSNSNTAGTFSNCEIYISNYAGSTNKSVSSDAIRENNATGGIQMRLFAGLWSNTSVITSVKLAPDYGNFAQHSTATLYGIKNS